jgi:hypothetical protein
MRTLVSDSRPETRLRLLPARLRFPLFLTGTEAPDMEFRYRLNFVSALEGIGRARRSLRYAFAWVPRPVRTRSSRLIAFIALSAFLWAIPAGIAQAYSYRVNPILDGGVDDRCQDEEASLSLSLPVQRDKKTLYRDVLTLVVGMLSVSRRGEAYLHRRQAARGLASDADRPFNHPSLRPAKVSSDSAEPH